MRVSLHTQVSRGVCEPLESSQDAVGGSLIQVAAITSGNTNVVVQDLQGCFELRALLHSKINKPLRTTYHVPADRCRVPLTNTCKSSAAQLAAFCRRITDASDHTRMLSVS